MVSQVIVPRGLETLPARPPTPPREKQQQQQQIEADSTSRRTRTRHSLLARSDLHTPPGHHYPESGNSGNPSSSRRTAKRVGFSAQPDYREPPTYNEKETAPKHPTPITAPSPAGSTRVIKSILKPSSVPNPLDPSGGSEDPNKQVNIAAMLESTVKQLAGADRESKLDAYMMLARALKASNNLPDRIALQDQMGLFMQFIQRDITTKSPAGTIDMSLTNHALTLLVTFLYFPAIASTLSYDFGVFIMDHCIRCFEDSSVPKDVVRHLMQVVASQDFSPKVMTADRVGRLVAALHSIEEHLKGKSIAMSRIIIYRKLVKQSKLHMVSHADWLLDLFADMLSTMKEIRTAAVALGFEAVFTIGKEKQLSRKVMEFLQLTIDGAKYIEYYVQKLLIMAGSKESAAVPQIWSVVILLLRCPVDRWEFFSPWLEIIQKCFNSLDHHTRLEANYAWNRFVYALYLNESSFSKTIGTVCQPYLSQIKRKVSRKYQEEFRRVVIGSICNLYYYAFKPNSTSSQIDHFWLVCVSPIMQKLATTEGAKQPEKSAPTSSDNLIQATVILTGLFDSSTPRLWKEDHIIENPLVRPDELPAIDPKWIRRNADKVFAVVEPIINKSFLDMANPESPTRNLWCTLLSAVAAAASKEVKVSSDTANFMAYAFSLLLKVWSTGPQQSRGENAQMFVIAIQDFLSKMIEYLGLLPFTESRLSMSKQNTFVPVATPSHRPGRGQGLTRTPLHHLFSILSTKPPQVPDDDSLLDLFRSTFNPFLMARPTQARLDFANELMRESLPLDVLSPYGPWLFVSEIISSSTENSQSSLSSNGSGSGPTIGHEYREIVKHLERGIKSTPNLPWGHWHSLFHLLVNWVTNETGEAGCAIAVVEPLAKILLDVLSTDNYDSVSMNMWKGGVEIIAAAKQPRDRQALDAARRRLWGTSVAGSRSASFDPFDNLYRLTNRLLEVSYTYSDAKIEQEMLAPILAEVAAFLTRCSRLLVFKSLTHLQPGICLWIQDTNSRYNSKQPPNVSETVKTLWERVCDLFTDPATLENFQLDVIEPLLCAAFESKHKHIVNAVAIMWNRAFDQVDSIQYPEKLKAVLLSIRPYVDIVLPGLDVSNCESESRQPAWIESQDDIEVSSSFKAGHHSTPQPELPPSSARSTPTGSVRLSLPKKKRSLETTPDPVRTRSSKRNSTPRLRHDDSQIHFAAIQSSSPTHNALESQHLTARQREVRERQRETATLFPEIRSSPERARSVQQSLQAAPQGQELSLPKQVQVSTPEAKQKFEEYVSSTPTPRRGQAPILDDDQDMMDDIPSSPPADPRRNLLSEMKPRSRSASILDEYRFSSSPVSGSPNANHRDLPHIQAPHEQVSSNNLEDLDEHMAGPSSDDGGEPKNISIAEATSNPPELVARVEDKQPQNGPIPSPNNERLTTPLVPPLLREAQETPKSDTEVFVDALTSPANHTSRKLRSDNKKSADTSRDQVPVIDNDGSFDLSDGEERSMARLIVELDSRKCEPLPQYGAESPEKPHGHQAMEVIDCITVDTGDSDSSQDQPRKTRSGRRLSPIVLSTPAEADSSESGKRSRKKRKRPSEQTEEASSKKQRHRKYVTAEDVDAVPDSQVPTTHDQVASKDTTPPTVEMGESIKKDEATKEDTLPALSDQPPSHPAGAGGSRSPSSTGSFDPEREKDAVDLQLWTEASQEQFDSHAPMEEASPLCNNQQLHESGGIAAMEEESKGEENAEGDVEMAEAADVPAVAAPQPDQEIPETPEPEKTSMEKVMGALKLGLHELRAASLSREEVYKIEDMFMDIKRELYLAESRGRK